jgi:hypothetical protein
MGSPARRLAAVLAFAPRNLGGEGIEALFPKPAKPVEPRVHFLKGCRLHGIDTACPIVAHARKPVLAQNPQVLGYGRLRNVELSLHHFDDTASRMLACREKLEDAASNRLAENVKGMP